MDAIIVLMILALILFYKMKTRYFVFQEAILDERKLLAFTMLEKSIEEQSRRNRSYRQLIASLEALFDFAPKLTLSWIVFFRIFSKNCNMHNESCDFSMRWDNFANQDVFLECLEQISKILHKHLFPCGIHLFIKKHSGARLQLLKECIFHAILWKELEKIQNSFKTHKVSVNNPESEVVDD